LSSSVGMKETTIAWGEGMGITNEMKHTTRKEREKKIKGKKEIKKSKKKLALLFLAEKKTEGTQQKKTEKQTNQNCHNNYYNNS